MVTELMLSHLTGGGGGGMEAEEGVGLGVVPPLEPSGLNRLSVLWGFGGAGRRGLPLEPPLPFTLPLPLRTLVNAGGEFENRTGDSERWKAGEGRKTGRLDWLEVGRTVGGVTGRFMAAERCLLMRTATCLISEPPAPLTVAALPRSLGRTLSDHGITGLGRTFGGGGGSRLAGFCCCCCCWLAKRKGETGRLRMISGTLNVLLFFLASLRERHVSKSVTPNSRFSR